VKASAVHCSVGFTVVPHADAAKAEVDTVLDQADIAMYRVKKLGRSEKIAPIAFSSIVEEHGRIAEYLEDANLFMIDIGEKVGVKTGQEFEVLHLDFDGHTPVTSSDGRTTKKIGVYPRRSTGVYLGVVNVQDEVAFCVRLDQSDKTPIRKESRVALYRRPGSQNVRAIDQ
jgi:hypothetical protein